MTPSGSTSTGEAESANRFSVLVLDDEQAVRELARRFLQTYGYDVLEAASIEEAVRVLRTSIVHAVILDVRLPGTRTGLDMLPEIRGRPELAGIPVLILSGSLLSDAEEAMMVRHRAHYFYKPEGYDTLVDFLDRLTGRDRSH